MKAVIPAAALAIIIVAHPAFAQSDHSSSESPLRRPAPVGHRQPTVADVQRAQAEKGTTGSSAESHRSSDIDQRLIICKGC
jgi:hypothetical protein